MVNKCNFVYMRVFDKHAYLCDSYDVLSRLNAWLANVASSGWPADPLQHKLGACARKLKLTVQM